MKRALVACTITSLFVTAIDAAADTAVAAGNVTGSWTAAGSPYVINGNVSVPNGGTLTIGAGVTVKFSGHYRFDVAGTLTATGTSAQPIVFTGTDATAGTRHWGLRFTNAKAAESVLTHVLVEHGRADNAIVDSSADDNGGGIYIFDSKVRIEDSELRDNEASVGGGIYVTGASPVRVRNTRIHHNTALDGSYNACGGGGIAVEYGDDTLFQSNLIYANVYSLASTAPNYEGGGGAFIRGSVKAFVNNTVAGNSAKKGAGLHLLPDFPNATINVSNNIVFGNTGSANGEQISLQTDYNSGVPFSGTQVIESNLVGTGGMKKVYRNDFEASYAGTNTLIGDPLFNDAALFDFGLKLGSPAIDRANSTVEGFPATDATGLVRFDDPMVANADAGSASYGDLGALERCPSGDTNGNHVCDVGEPDGGPEGGVDAGADATIEVGGGFDGGGTNEAGGGGGGTTAEGGVANDVGDGPPVVPADDGGCDCGVASADGTRAALGWTTLLVGLAFARARRRNVTRR